ncbi:MAG: hypothetical protein E6364_06165, partial [Staphylococcus sp.]|nr:hypothetical protein [Staphylococcus sp.]
NKVINIAKNNAEIRLGYTSKSRRGITKSSSKFKIKKETKKYTKYKTNFKINLPFPTKRYHKHNFKYPFRRVF